jgi:hypothetical protein
MERFYVKRTWGFWSFSVNSNQYWLFMWLIGPNVSRKAICPNLLWWDGVDIIFGLLASLKGWSKAYCPVPVPGTAGYGTDLLLFTNSWFKMGLLFLSRSSCSKQDCQLRVLTVDQCKRCSTMWFILLKEIKLFTIVQTFTHPLTNTLLFKCTCNILTLMGTDSAASRLDLAWHSSLSCFLHLCWIPTATFVPTGWARPRLSLLFPSLCPHFWTGSRKSCIQATLRTIIGDTTILLRQKTCVEWAKSI